MARPVLFGSLQYVYNFKRTNKQTSAQQDINNLTVPSKSQNLVETSVIAQVVLYYILSYHNGSLRYFNAIYCKFVAKYALARGVNNFSGKKIVRSLKNDKLPIFYQNVDIFKLPNWATTKQKAANERAMYICNIDISHKLSWVLKLERFLNL